MPEDDADLAGEYYPARRGKTPSLPLSPEPEPEFDLDAAAAVLRPSLEDGAAGGGEKSSSSLPAAQDALGWLSSPSGTAAGAGAALPGAGAGRGNSNAVRPPSRISGKPAPRRSVLSRAARWNAGGRAAARRGMSSYAQFSTGSPVVVLLAGFAVLALTCVGVIWSVFSPEPDANFLTAWLTPNSWRQADREAYEANWGLQRLDQVIITPADGSTFLGPGGAAAADGNAALLAAYDFYVELTNSSIGVEGGMLNVSFADVCFQPAAPVLLDCFSYNPLRWWNSSREQIAADPTPGQTLTQMTVDGGIPGLNIRRIAAWGGVVEEAGTVTEVAAMMVWAFVDVNKERAADPLYIPRADAWENGLLDLSRRWNAKPDSPIRIAYKIDSSVQSTIEEAVQGDMAVVYSALFFLFFMHGVVAAMLDRTRWQYGVATTASLGFAVFAQLGAYGWTLKLNDAVVKFGGAFLLVLVTVTVGTARRMMSVLELRATGSIEYVAAHSMLSGTLLNLAMAVAFAYLALSMDTPALVAYAVVTCAGFVTDTLATLTIEMVALVWIKRRMDVAAADAAADADADAERGVERTQTSRSKSETTALLKADKRTERTAAGPGGAASSGNTSAIGSPSKLRRRTSTSGAVYRRPVYFWWCILSLIGCSLNLWLSSDELKRGWQPYVPTSRLVPQSSYIYKWSEEYDKYFGGNPLPVDFPIIGVDITDPTNGPLILEAGDLIENSPYLNRSEFRNFYRAYQAFCLTQDGPICNCPSTMVDGSWLTEESFTLGIANLCVPNMFTKFISEPEFQSNAADMGTTGCDDLLNAGCLWNGQAKFGATTIDGSVAGYSGQLELPLQMRNLALEVADIFSRAGVVRSGAGAKPGVYGYAAAFPFFETWQPARDDLWNTAIASCVAGVALSVLTLDLWSFLVTVLGLSTAVSIAFSVGVITLEHDLNLVTAVDVFIVAPMLFSMMYHAAYHVSSEMMFTGSAVTAAHDFVAFSQRVYGPGMVAFIVVSGLGNAIFFFAGSPVNLEYVALYEIILVSGVAVGLAVVPPLLSFPFYARLRFPLLDFGSSRTINI